MATLPDPFDTLLITDCDILGPAAGADEAGQKTLPLVLLATVKVRFCAGKGKAKEFKADKKFALNWHLVFMRPYPALTTGHWLRIGGQTFDVMHIDNPSLMDHHYEVTVEEING